MDPFYCVTSTTYLQMKGKVREKVERRKERPENSPKTTVGVHSGQDRDTRSLSWKGEEDLSNRSSIFRQ